MKIKIDIDCSPEEARAFFGLPELAPFQQAIMDDMKTRMGEALSKMDPEAMLKAWMPTGAPGWEQWQKAWRSAVPGETSGGKPKS